MHTKRIMQRSRHPGRSLFPKLLPGRHQRVETLLQRYNLKCHVTGGEDENADTARGHKNNPEQHTSNGSRERSGHCLVEVLMFHVARGHLHKQIDEEDSVQGQRVRGFVSKGDSMRRLR